MNKTVTTEYVHIGSLDKKQITNSRLLFIVTTLMSDD